jgi:hypothetical protein
MLAISTRETTSVAPLVKIANRQIRITPVINRRWNDHSATGNHASD